MNELEAKNRMRYQFLHYIYEKSGGNNSIQFNKWKIGEKLGFSKDETKTVCQYLEGEMLIEPRALGGEIAITHYGVKEIERPLEAPNEPTGHFPPVVNITKIRHMENSQLQQGTFCALPCLPLSLGER